MRRRTSQERGATVLALAPHHAHLPVAVAFRAARARRRLRGGHAPAGAPCPPSIAGDRN
ncbi:hypothetical protein [Nocardioides sp.]|uniref:hypothetical protein n=1 Tax=Nocardioides sp. TaxID=35761 RepID=UPI0026245383|nr:hypothetical protein [Nocardioides sp.]